MKRLSFYLGLTAMMLFAGNAALAQHGHESGAAGMGSSHSMRSTSHGNAGPNSKTTGSRAW